MTCHHCDNPNCAGASVHDACSRSMNVEMGKRRRAKAISEGIRGGWPKGRKRDNQAIKRGWPKGKPRKKEDENG